MRERSTWLAGLGRDSRTFARWPELVARLHASDTQATSPFRVLSRPSSSFSRAEYAAAFERVKGHIRRGDCYQVNLTQRFTARAEGDAWHAYLRSARDQPGAVRGVPGLPDGRVLSARRPSASCA